MKPANPSVNLPEVEQRILNTWKESKTFEKSLELRKDSQPYMFYDGPPFATGTPHYGHLLAGTIKDIIPRYQTMKGRYVERRFGWDTHGLPIEMTIEKQLNLNGRNDILEYGIDKFNEACRQGVFGLEKVWEQVTGRLGRWVDFENDYKTMDLNFMDSVWWVFKQLWDRDRVYKGARVVPYSWRLSTPLSNFEASSNYKTVQDPAVTLRFKLIERPEISLLAWTTTPWTLPSNLALCVGPTIDYSHITLEDGEQVMLASERLEAYFKDSSSYEINSSCKGSDLVGLAYEPLFPFFSVLSSQGAFQVLSDSYVTTEDGTGVVHQSPAHGEDDFRICSENNLPLIDPVDAEGNFTVEAADFAGQNIKEADRDIISSLKKRGLLFKHETLEHSYPYCERSNTPLIYKAISAWYVKVEDIREQMTTNNNTVHWIPEHIKHGRFGKWLEGARDWNISRNRFWGNPIPIWICESCNAMECVGSHAELEEKCSEQVNDLHSHFVDKLTWACAECGGTMQRTPEVLDCWFESGSMPYAQLHYPFENKERFDASFPADFIAEGLDQTRGWFYTLMVLSSTIFEKTPFKNVIVNGMILAEDGKKMSKSLKNYPDPVGVMDSHGADALRMYLMRSPVVRGESLRFSENGVKEIVRTVILPFWNVYSFFTTYADVDGYTLTDNLTESANPLDRWIISRFQTLLKNVEKEMSEYRLYAVVPALLDFLEELTNWHVRRSRRRFWSDDTRDKTDGYNTLYYILIGFARALAPFIPFVTEEIYQNLATLDNSLPDSVHLTDYPVADEALVNTDLEAAMSLIQRTVGLGRSLRSQVDIKTRQPLQSITVVTRNEDDATTLQLYGAHIREELNVKEVLFSSNEDELVKVTVKPNFPVLGPLFGKEMKRCGQELANLTNEAIETVESGGLITILGRELDSTAVDIRREAIADFPIETAGGVTVYFDTVLTDALISEGLARELVNRIQRMRKEADYQISDRITVHFHTDKKLAEVFASNSEYIREETLARDIVAEDTPAEGDISQTHLIDNTEVCLTLQKI